MLSRLLFGLFPLLVGVPALPVCRLALPLPRRRCDVPRAGFAGAVVPVVPLFAVLPLLTLPVVPFALPV